jgi:heat-inducible transcriptional repressor
MEMLDERKRLILKAVIQDYIFSAEPVGSRTLVKRHDIGLSPATIRNEMADLEEMGYLEQPHTSAGRIPSHRGYRFYVNSMMEDFSIDTDELDQLEELMSAVNVSVSGFPREMAKLLSSLTSYISLIAEPSFIGLDIRHIDIIPLTAFSASIIVVLSDGSVKHHTINMPPGLALRQIKSLTRFVNRRLQGVMLKDIDDNLLSDLKKEFAGNVDIVDDIFTVVKYLMFTGKDDHLIIDGATNLLNQPEFKDVNKVRDLLNSLEQNEQLWQLMMVEPNRVDDLEIKIGSEIGLESFNDCSLVVATFSQRDRRVMLGILGPARMHYAKTIGFMRWLKDYFEYLGGKNNDR